LRKVIEAILLLADRPVPATEMSQVLERPLAEIEAALEALAASYEAEGRGFVLRAAAGGWRLYSAPDCAPWLERFVLGGRHGRLTGAALEVLAIVAYKGPLSRAQIAELRGVDSDGVVRTLQARGLIAELERRPGEGGPTLFRVSDQFLERMGLNSLDELPPLAGFMPDADAVEEMEAKLSPDG
jgi:segregation and condensation protein B